MKFLVDQDVYFITIESLRKKGYDVLTAKDIGMQRASDEELLDKAKELGRILITRDKGFGALVFLKYRKTSGVILLRMSPEEIDNVHRELFRLIEEQTFENLKKLFCVVESDGYRIRRIPETEI